MARTWDMGDPEPAELETVITSFGETEDGRDLDFGRCSDGTWKGYVFGRKCYLSWPELLRRFGPLVEVGE